MCDVHALRERAADHGAAHAPGQPDGSGTYFDARDAAGLDKALSLALRPGFDVLDGHKSVVASGFVGGEPIQLMPGTYSVKLKGGRGGSRSITVRAKETTAVQF